jgi:Phosphotransferase enzyme family
MLRFTARRNAALMALWEDAAMAGSSDSEIDIDERLIVRLLEEQAPHLAGLRAMKIKDGWDNAVWRLGDVLAIRITRRAVAVDLHRHEQRWLPVLAPGLPLPVPAPVVVGIPGTQFPWPWSVVPWFEGDVAARGGPLASRQDAMARWAEQAMTIGDEALIAEALGIFHAGLVAATATERVWSAYHQVSPAMWHRARAWAALFGLSFLSFGLPGDPTAPDTEAHELGRRQLRRVVAEQRPPGILRRYW